jgi:hypothetical protein
MVKYYSRRWDTPPGHVALSSEEIIRASSKPHLSVRALPAAVGRYGLPSPPLPPSLPGQDRAVPVGQWACYFTEAYVKNVRPWQVSDPAEKALFVLNTNGRRLSPRAVGDIVDRATARSGVGRRVSPHTFRHSMATHMLRNHADLRHIQAILGHASLRSTQIYTHTDIEDLKGVMKLSHPHGNRLPASTQRSKMGRQETGDIQNEQPI